MDPLTLALLAAGVSAAGQGIKAGIERRQATKAAEQVFTEEEEQRLRDLQAMQEAGQLGLTEEQSLALDAQLRQQASAQAMQTQAQQLAAQAAAPASARDVFLQQAATQAQRQEAVTQENILRQQAEEAAQAAQTQEIQQLLLSRLQAQQIAAGAPSVAGAALGSVAEAAPGVLEVAAEEQATAESIENLLESYQAPQQNNAYAPYLPL